MKANWKWALMGLAVVAMISCKSKNDPENNGEQPQDEPEFISKVSIKDASVAEWANLPAEYVAEAVCPEDAALLGLKSVKVYADKLYINILVEPDMDEITDLDWVPFHVYINTDNNDLTGGFSDQFTDPNADILLETAVFASGEPNVYNPGVFKWWGEVGGGGWEWTDPSIPGISEDASQFYGAIVGEGQLPVGNSQYVDGKFEIQIMRALIPCKDFAPWAEEFSIGFDIQQSWTSVGVLPLVSPTDANANGYTDKLQVKVDMTD